MKNFLPDKNQFFIEIIVSDSKHFIANKTVVSEFSYILQVATAYYILIINYVFEKCQDHAIVRPEEVE